MSKRRRSTPLTRGKKGGNRIGDYLALPDDARPFWKRVDPGVGLTLEEALLYYGPKREAELVAKLELAGYGGDPPLRVGHDGWPTPLEELADFRIKARGLREAREELEQQLIEKLRTGELVATGFGSHSPLDLPATLIVPDRWRVLEANFERSEATGPGIVISGILVFRKSERKQQASKTRAFAAARLRDWYVKRIAAWEQNTNAPSREQDWQDAQAEFGSTVPREAVRQLRRELAPEAWTRLGRRKRRP